MLTFNVSEEKIKEICLKIGVDRKTMYSHPYEANDPVKTLYANNVPKAFLEALRDDLPPSDPTKVLLENFLTPPGKILEKTASTMTDVLALLSAIQGRGDVIGVKSGKLRFPVTISGLSLRDDLFGKRITVTFSFNYGDVSSDSYASVYAEHIETNGGSPLTLGEILTKANFLTFNPDAYKAHTDRVARTYRQQTEMSGKLVRIKGPVYVRPRWGEFPVEVQIGSGEKKAIIESELELSDTMWYNSSEGSSEVIPLVRVFLLDRKAYCYVHVDNITEHKYDKTGFQKVVMPDKVRSLFEQVFSAGPESTFGDIFGGRHGGVVVLADGPPGVGKTLTAEAVAELSERPLYVADVGEIGIDLDSVEDKLKLILDRASKWNAVLLLDEADIFLVKRDVDNIERNAIVGTFLKFLDGFDGTLFLTTNRVEVIDPAFASRITARIHYDALDAAAREKIWSRMVEAAKIVIPAGELKTLAEKKMNGRQIRNVVRLAKMFYRDKALTAKDFDDLDEHILKVDETWDAPTSSRMGGVK